MTRPYGIVLFDTIAESVGFNTADSGGTTVTTGAANTKNATYSEIIASTAYDTNAITISFANFSAAGDMLVDIAIGAAGSEQVIISNIYNYNRAGQTAHNYTLPCNIPAGSRVSANAQAPGINTTFDISIVLWAGGHNNDIPYDNPLTYGANAANSGCTDIDPGGTANTLGAYAQLTASLTRPANGFILVIDNNNDNARTAAQWILRLAIGAGGSEQIIATFLVGCDASADIVLPAMFYCALRIPASTRVAIAAQCTINTAGDRSLGAELITL